MEKETAAVASTARAGRLVSTARKTFASDVLWPSVRTRIHLPLMAIAGSTTQALPIVRAIAVASPLVVVR
jgi:ABC-type phosphate transport system ATPase subunit